MHLQKLYTTGTETLDETSKRKHEIDDDQMVTVNMCILPINVQYI